MRTDICMFVDVILWGLASVLIYKFFQQERRKRLNLPPVVEGGSFIFGQVGRNRRDPINFIFENQKKYGNVFVVEGIFGFFRTNFIVGEEALNLLLKAPEEKFNFKKGVATFIRAIFGKPKEQPKEEDLDQNNRISKGIKRSQKLNQLNIDKALNEVLTSYSKKKDFEFNEFVEDIIFSINISSMLGSDAMKDYEEIKNTLAGIETNGLKFFSLFFPDAPFGSSQKTRELKKKSIELLRPYISKRRQTTEKVDDYLSIWAQSPHVAGDQKGQDYSDEEITNQIINITIAAHLNTAVSLLYILIHLYNNPAFLLNMKQELTELKETESDLQSSKLIGYTIKEVLRLTSGGSFLRRIEEDTYYEGYLLEKGSLISSSAAAIHFDSKIFPDPLSFKPERWEDSSLIKYGFWFGNGPHRCKGDGYALQILKSAIVEFVLNWDLKFNNKESSDFQVDWTNNRRPKGHLSCNLKQN